MTASYACDPIAPMTEPTSAATLIARGTRQLASGNTAHDSAALDAQLLLAHALGLERSRLLAHADAVVDAAGAERYRQLLCRREAGEPLAYLTRRREFWSLQLIVTPDVLIPRPETELLVERALALRSGASGRVADLGTGSGAIAIALARERPGWHIVAPDVSAAALGVARRNSEACGVSIELRQGDWYAALGAETFDLLLSNPPYVAADDPALHALRFEPRAALSPGRDALQSLRTLVRGAARHLRPGGWLLLEHGATQGAQLRAELVLAGFGYVRSHRDLAGHERITEGQHDQI
jgi:release factor glutamine methyltransferase